MKKFTLFKGKDYKTNVENYLGKEAVVIKILEGGKYRVKIFSEEWNAISDQELNVGDRVKILKVEGTNLKVLKEVK
jgi:membrane protein implicated in regulation of membrane protease activity